jgi:HD-like signal output (HDOD) protein
MDVPKVLFVDDEVGILNALRRGMRLHCREWQAEFCNSPAEALTLLPAFAPWVVVSDMRMPDMNGADFLRLVSQQTPEIIRVLLTGDTSPEVALTVSETAHMLIAKPVQFETLIQMLHRAQCLRMFPVSPTIRQQIGSITHFPVLQRVYQQLVEYLQSDDIDTQEIARIISQDPNILAKLMQLANSAFFGFSSHVSNAHETVVRLGVELVKNIVLCLGVFTPDDRMTDVMSEQLFVEAMLIAGISRQLSIACGCKRREADDSYVLGLLHDVGRLMSDIQTVDDDRVTQSNEVNVIGAYLLALWEFDSDFVNAVLYQDAPENMTNVTSLCCRLYVAKAVVKARKQGESVLDEKFGLNLELLQYQGLLDAVMIWINQYESVTREGHKL